MFQRHVMKQRTAWSYPASILLTASLGEMRGCGEAERRRREPSRGAAGAEVLGCG